jgi:hypothetical protein
VVVVAVEVAVGVGVGRVPQPWIDTATFNEAKAVQSFPDVAVDGMLSELEAKRPPNLRSMYGVEDSCDEVAHWAWMLAGLVTMSQ